MQMTKAWSLIPSREPKLLMQPQQSTVTLYNEAINQLPLRQEIQTKILKLQALKVLILPEDRELKPLSSRLWRLTGSNSGEFQPPKGKDLIFNLQALGNLLKIQRVSISQKNALVVKGKGVWDQGKMVQKEHLKSLWSLFQMWGHVGSRIIA